MHQLSDTRALRVLLLEGIHPSARIAFERAGYRAIEEEPSALPSERLIERLQNIDIVGIRSRSYLKKELLDAAPNLLAIGCYCIGTNQVDLDHAMDLGIPVFNAPFSNTRSVAELTISAIVMLMRGMPKKNAEMHRGLWRKNADGSFEVRGKTLGIVGYGNIGAQVSVLAEALGMQVRYFDVDRKLPIGSAKPAESLRALLEVSDIVTIHVPETSYTKSLLDAHALKSMKRGSWLINYSRGTVVDIAALTGALESGHLAGAALDVFPAEPESSEEEFVSPLREFENVLLSPHVGGSTAEAQDAIGEEVSEKLLRYADNGSTVGTVNFPHVTLPEHTDAHRFLNIHRNVPGMLQAINAVFSSAGVNIVGQFLQTNTKIGYVVVDIAKDSHDPAEFRRKIDLLEGSIRTRILH